MIFLVGKVLKLGNFVIWKTDGSLCFFQDFSNIFSLLQSVKARDEGRGETGGGGKQPVAEEPQHQRTQAPPTHGYSRYSQEKFRGQEGVCVFVS